MKGEKMSKKPELLAAAAIMFTMAVGFSQVLQGATYQHREKVLGDSQTDSSAVDCTTKDLDVISAQQPQQSPLFDVDGGTANLSVDGASFTAATWSPTGEKAVFVAPTNEVITLSQPPKGSQTQMLGISRNQLWLYDFKSEEWTKLAENGTRPSFSPDGRLVFYLSDSHLATFDTVSKKHETVKLAVDSDIHLLLHGFPRSDGMLFAPWLDLKSGMPLANAGKLQGVELAASDRVIPSPDGKNFIVSYAGIGFPPALVMFGPTGKDVVLTRNCANNGSQPAWSRDGRQLAFVVPGENPSIHLYDAPTHKRGIVIRPSNASLIGGLSFSPDEKYIAFSTVDNDGTMRIRIATTDGASEQVIAPGLSPNWSPTGERLLYASPTANGTLSWHVITLIPHS
jgi:dipeptidyl aminopeptidase/acylaminoacyl peptidase